MSATVFIDRQRKAGDAQAWPVTSHRMMMIGIGMPISQRSAERMQIPMLKSAW
jgi:hypothetical protein